MFSVADRQFCRRLGAEGRRHGDIHRTAVFFFIEGTSPRKQLFRLGGVLRPRAEHLRAFFAQVVALGKAAAGKGLLQGGTLLRRRATALVQKFSIDIGNDRHILGALHAALQLEAVHPHLLHLHGVGGEVGIFQAEGMIAAAGGVHAVGQTAGLGTGAAIAAALADESRHGTLTRIAHTQRPVDKGLDLRRTLAADLRNFPFRQLSGQHNALHTQLGGVIGTA